jgi:hypothetical protein
LATLKNMPLVTSPRTNARRAAQLAMALALSVAVRPALAGAQSANGSIAVSLTVLQPVSTEAVKLIGVDVDRAGMARIAMTAPVSGPASQLVMTSVSSSTSRFVPVQQAPSTVRARSAVGAPMRFDYLVDVGTRHQNAAAQRPVEVRIQYLAVAGT